MQVIVQSEIGNVTGECDQYSGDYECSPGALVTEHSHASVGMRCANGWRRRSLAHGVLLIPETL